MGVECNRQHRLREWDNHIIGWYRPHQFFTARMMKTLAIMRQQGLNCVARVSNHFGSGAVFAVAMPEITLNLPCAIDSNYRLTSICPQQPLPQGHIAAERNATAP